MGTQTARAEVVMRALVRNALVRLNAGHPVELPDDAVQPNRADVEIIENALHAAAVEAVTDALGLTAVALAEWIRNNEGHENVEQR